MIKYIKFQWWPDMWIIGMVYDIGPNTIAFGLGPINLQIHIGHR